MTEFNAVWDRIQRHAGATFKTKTGMAFTYRVPGAYLRVSRNGHEIERSLSRTNFEKATKLLFQQTVLATSRIAKALRTRGAS